ncbi:hypothetical protein AALP_AA7G121500 [Arabis alpina]|uniref:Uncharacterized protein n=1 Tax=Arabis alpina TaxID=50452 RepID=A0A087GHJ1_ARAAL|nr:hypothetical protein AALP_AA7G121500 [Arabis alpina]
MACPLQTITTTVVLVSLVLGCAEQVSGIRYIPNSSKIKYSDFLVPQPSGLIPGLGRFLLPPHPKTPFHLYKAPLAAAPVPCYGIPSWFAPNTGYEASDHVPPVPQP